jgi:hypothetical protein
MSFAAFTEFMQPFHSAAGAAFNTFTTFQDISPQKPLIPAEMLDLPGKKIEIEAWGEYSCATGVTLSLGVFLNAASTAWATAAFTTGTTPAAWPWHVKWHGLVLTQGSAASVLGQGVADIGSSLTAFGSGQAFPATAAARTVASINLTQAFYAGVGAAWSASAAGNTIKTNMLSVAVLN